MTTADWAFIVSLGSLAVSIAGFVWNIWSKFIYPKPRLRVEMANRIVIGDGWERTPQSISLSATNHGPGEVTLENAVARPRRRMLGLRKPRHYGILNPFNNWPYDETSNGPFSGLPKTLKVGETLNAHFPRSRRWFDKFDLVAFGFTDSFGRYHWAPRKHCRRVRSEVLGDKTLQRFDRSGS